jgi:hypothetical protein
MLSQYPLGDVLKILIKLQDIPEMILQTRRHKKNDDWDKSYQRCFYSRH